MESISSPSPLKELMFSFSKRTSMPRSFRCRTVFKRSTVFLAKRWIDLVRMMSMFPASHSASMRLNSSRFLVPVLSVLFAFTGKPIFTMFLFRLWNRTNEHLVTYLNLCLQVVFLTCEIYIGLYNLCNFNVAISIILIVELMIDVVIGLKLFHNQSI